MYHILCLHISGQPKFDAKFVGLIWHVLRESASRFGRKRLLIHGNVGTPFTMPKTISDKGISNC